jgi:hypothetical protein
MPKNNNKFTTIFDVIKIFTLVFAISLLAFAMFFDLIFDSAHSDLQHSVEAQYN